MRLKTKITLTIVVLVLAVVGVTSWLYLRTLTQQVIREFDERANLVPQQIFLLAQNALRDAANEGQAPASQQPSDVREYVRNALDQNGALTSLIDAEVGYSLLVYEVTIVDQDGTVLISSFQPQFKLKLVFRRSDLQVGRTTAHKAAFRP